MNHFLDKFKRVFSKKEDKEWLNQIIEKAEEHCAQGTTLPYHIVGIREKGFLVKVAGLYGFAFFNHMPWTYAKPEHWQMAYPYLSDIRFFCKIHKILKDPLRTYIDGKVHQFKQMNLEPNQSFTGIILDKTTYGVFVDIGYEFNWEFGSMVGLLHKGQFKSCEEMDDCLPGTLMQVLVQGYNTKGKLALGRRNEFLDWDIGKPQTLIGQESWALVKKNPASKKCLFYIKGIYKSLPLIDPEHYHPLLIDRINERMRLLKDNETIECNILGADEKKRVLLFKWNIEHMMEIIPGTTIDNLLNQSTIGKLQEIKSRMSY